MWKLLFLCPLHAFNFILQYFVNNSSCRENVASRLFSTECTFIVLDTERWSGQARGEEDCMVGDVNLFLTDTEDPTLGEIEIMIAGKVLLASLGLCHFV